MSEYEHGVGCQCGWCARVPTSHALPTIEVQLRHDGYTERHPASCWCESCTTLPMVRAKEQIEAMSYRANTIRRPCGAIIDLVAGSWKRGSNGCDCVWCSNAIGRRESDLARQEKEGSERMRLADECGRLAAERDDARKSETEALAQVERLRRELDRARRVRR